MVEIVEMVEMVEMAERMETVDSIVELVEMVGHLSLKSVGAIERLIGWMLGAVIGGMTSRMHTLTERNRLGPAPSFRRPSAS